MDKVSQLMEGDVPAYFMQRAAGGALAGGSIAALLSLIHSINAKRSEISDLKKRKAGDPDAIHITLPVLKKAEVKGCAPSISRVGPKITETKIKNGSLRSWKGQFGEKLINKQSSYGRPTLQETMAGRIVALAAAIAGGYGVHSVYDSYRKDYLKGKIDKTKERYMHALLDEPDEDSVKLANSIIDLDQIEKLANTFKDRVEAFRQSVNKEYKTDIGTNTLAFLGLALLGGIGGTGYLTKEVLDEHQRRISDKALKPALPAPSRIVVHRRPLPKKVGDPTETTDEPQLLTEKESNSIKAAFWIIHDVVSGNNGISKSAAVRAVCSHSGTSIEKLAKVIDESEYIDTKVLSTIPDAVADVIVKEAFLPTMVNKMKDYAVQKAINSGQGRRVALNTLGIDPDDKEFNSFNFIGNDLALDREKFRQLGPFAINNFYNKYPGAIERFKELTPGIRKMFPDVKIPEIPGILNNRFGRYLAGHYDQARGSDYDPNINIFAGQGVQHGDSGATHLRSLVPPNAKGIPSNWKYHPSAMAAAPKPELPKQAAIGGLLVPALTAQQVKSIYDDYFPTSETPGRPDTTQGSKGVITDAEREEVDNIMKNIEVEGDIPEDKQKLILAALHKTLNQSRLRH